jgi:hypothetical protein
MYKRNANPVLAFLMDDCEAAPKDYIEKIALQQRCSSTSTSTPSAVLPTPSLTLEEKEREGEEIKRISKVGYSKTLDGVDGQKEDESPKIGPTQGETCLLRAARVAIQWTVLLLVSFAG